MRMLFCGEMFILHKRAPFGGQKFQMFAQNGIRRKLCKLLKMRTVAILFKNLKHSMGCYVYTFLNNDPVLLCALCVCVHCFLKGEEAGNIVCKLEKERVLSSLLALTEPFHRVFKFLLKAETTRIGGKRNSVSIVSVLLPDAGWDIG